MEFLTWLENLGMVTWVRESDSLLGYTLYLAGHTIGLVFLIGPNLLIAARVLGAVRDLPLRPLASLRPVMTIGLWLTVITGLVLFATAPVSYVRNVVFLIKIGSIVLAYLCLHAVVRRLFAPGAEPDAVAGSARVRRLTAASLLLWTVAVVAGRLTAYSPVVVIASVTAFAVAVGIIAVIGGAAGIFLFRRGQSRTEAFPLDVHPTPASGGK